MTGPAQAADSAGADPALAALDQLRARGGDRWDPVRLRYLEVLAQRLASASPPVREVLARKLQAALADSTERFELSQQAASPPPHPFTDRVHDPASHWAGLHQQLHQAANGLPPTGPDEAVPVKRPPGLATELKSVRRFRQTWERISVQQRVEQAVGRRPENAGPLNSHRLVLQSLELMRSLSPAYLQRFVAHMDTVLWLEQALPAAPTANAPGSAAPASHRRKKK